MTTMTEPPVEEQPAKPSRLQSLMQLELTKGKVKRKDLMHFSRQLAVFLHAGIPILEALDAITEEVGNKAFRTVLLEMSADLQSGSTFSGAAGHHPNVFPQYYLGILSAAELTGNLDTALDRLADYIERDLETRRKVTSALTYPSVIFAMAIIVVVVLSVFVLPRFERFFKSLNAKLPLPTRMLLGFTHFMENWWWLLASVLAVAVIALLVASRTDRGKEIRDHGILRIPMIGGLIHHALLERFCRVLSSMLVAGVPLPTALSVTTDSVGNSVWRAKLSAAREEVMRGGGLARPLAATGLFPAAARQMLVVGERTGTIDEQLENAAGYFDRELEYQIKKLTTVFEPAVLIFVGVVVGFVAIALVSAMYGIFRQVHL